MMENQEKEELIEMKAEPKKGGKTCRKSSRVRLGVGNSHIGIEVLLGIEMAHLGELGISMKTPKDSSRVRLGVGNLLLGVEVRLGVASLHLGEGPPSTDEDTCLRLGEECRAGIRIFPLSAQS